MKVEWLLLALIVIFGILSFLILRPYLNYIIFAAILVFITYPIYKKIKIKLGKATSALILIICMILIVIIPSFYISTILFLEARDVFQNLGAVEFEKLKNLEESISSRTGIGLNITKKIGEATTDLSVAAISYIATNIPKLTKAITNLFIGFTVMLFTMFYLYVDGERIARRMKELLPLEEKYRNQFFRQAYSITEALFLGIFLVALIQGLIAGIGYFLFGVPNPIFWGIATATVALIPVLGAPWAYVPLSLYLMYKGSLLAGIGLLLYGIIIVSQIDNIIRPKFVRMKTGIGIHPLTVILGVIGGIVLFGVVGLIIGPLILALFLELLAIYRKR